MNGSKNFGTFTQWNTTQRSNKELLPFAAAWMELESIMLSAIQIPGGERQIPYDLTCKWNLINETNKQAKYSQKN